jgi:hypothetical protein
MVLHTNPILTINALAQVLRNPTSVSSQLNIVSSVNNPLLLSITLISLAIVDFLVLVSTKGGSTVMVFIAVSAYYLDGNYKFTLLL